MDSARAPLTPKRVSPCGRSCRLRRIGSAIVGEVSRCLIEPHAMQLPGRDVRLNLVPEGNHQILSRRIDAAQELDLIVQIAMITFVDDRALENALELGEIHDVTGFRIRLSTKRDLEHVVVSMPVRIRAQPVARLIPLLAFRGIVEPVRRVKVHLPGDENGASQHARRGGLLDSGRFRHGRSEVTTNRPRSMRGLNGRAKSQRLGVDATDVWTLAGAAVSNGRFMLSVGFSQHGGLGKGATERAFSLTPTPSVLFP